LLVPFASLLLPRLLVPVLPPDAPTWAATQDMQPAIPINDANTSLPGTTHGSSANSVAPHVAADKDIPAVAADTATADPQPEAHQSGVVARPRALPLLVFTWLLGSALSATLFVVSLAAQRMRLGRLQRIEDADWLAAVTARPRHWLAAAGRHAPVDPPAFSGGWSSPRR
jgi:hypothetical protein